MNDYHLTKANIVECFDQIQDELEKRPHLIVSVQDGNTGKWGMARLWRTWMATTAAFMSSNGVTQPLYIKANGEHVGSRGFEPEDAHALFTMQWLGCDKEGNRLSWSKKGRDGMRPASKGERFDALRKHEVWAVNKGLKLLNPRDSEYSRLQKEQEQ